jgi:hypothetical protein
MIRITLMDGSSKDIPRAEVREILPLPILFSSPHLKKPFSALFSRCGKAIPVEGLLPKKLTDADKKIWMLLCESKAYVISALPVFLEDSQAAKAPASQDNEEEELANEIEQLEKMLKESA